VVAHVNDVAHVARTLVAGLNRVGRSAVLVDLPKPGAGLPWPWKAASLPARAATIGMVAARLRQMRPDLVHVHYASQAAVGWLSGRPYVVHCHGSDIRGVRPDSLWDRGIAPAIRRAAAVLYSTPDLAADAGRFRRDAEFLPNPVDTDLFRPGTTPDRDVLVGIRLDPIKGAEIAIESVLAVLQMRPGTSVTIVVDGSQRRRLTAELGPAFRLIRPVRHEQMADLFRQHRVAVGQFGVGSIGVYELEALASGLPVVADFRYPAAYGDDRPPLEPIDPVDRAGDAAAQLARLLGDEAVWRAASRASREWVVRNHATGVVIERLLGIYARALGEPVPST
jgi:glycosyltransferase involved in cell wall biosynthesis